MFAPPFARSATSFAPQGATSFAPQVQHHLPEGQHRLHRRCNISICTKKAACGDRFFAFAFRFSLCQKDFSICSKSHVHFDEIDFFRPLLLRVPFCP
jgi:hypothetical protein